MSSCSTEKKEWLAFGDIHGVTAPLEKIKGLDKASGIIVHGDLTNEGSRNDVESVVNELLNTGLPVLAQMGNMDVKEANNWLEEKHINLHAHVRELSPEIIIFGIGGSTYTPMHTPTEFSEEEYARWLSSEWEKARNYPVKILVSHNPPKDTKCDDLGNGVHVGSGAVREFIEKYQPDMCICGHIHEAKGVDYIGKTKIINPGAFADGGYVRITYNNGALNADLEQIVAE